MSMFAGVTKGTGPKNHRHTKKIITFVILMILSVGLYLGYHEYIAPALTVGSKTYSNSDLKRIIEQSKKDKLTRSQAINTIIEYEQSIAIINDFKITINESAISQIISGLNFGSSSKPTDWQKINATLLFIKSQLQNKKEDGYEGYFLSFPFTRHLFSSQEDPRLSDPKFKNVAAIEEDKKYAFKKANQARQELLSGTVKPENIVETILKDERLIYGNAKNRTGFFSVNKLGQTYTAGSSSSESVAALFIQLLPTMPDQSIGEIKIEQVTYRDPTTNQIQSSESSYYFIVKTKNRPANPNIDKAFSNARKKIKVTNDAL